MQCQWWVWMKACIRVSYKIKYRCMLGHKVIIHAVYPGYCIVGRGPSVKKGDRIASLSWICLHCSIFLRDWYTSNHYHYYCGKVNMQCSPTQWVSVVNQAVSTVFTIVVILYASSLFAQGNYLFKRRKAARNNFFTAIELARVEV